MSLNPVYPVASFLTLNRYVWYIRDLTFVQKQKLA